MNTAAATERDTRCPVCGSARDASLPDGLCARCLLAYALGADSDTREDDLSTPILADEAFAFIQRNVGRYRLLAEIDRGGVGVVYRAWQADLGREVALKMLLPSRLETKDARDRFRREAELMASLDHPGILPVHEVGEHAGLPYYSMKLAERGNLAQRIPALRGRYDEIASLLVSIARAVGHGHGRGVLHRDLKPSNIVFDASGQCMVTDFGLARRIAVDSSLTGIDALIGTPRYVAPEVVTTSGARLTASADVYGLGAILYELLTGQAPFAELTPLQILQQVATRRPQPPRRIDPTIPLALEAICLRCLEKRPGDRYASADALADALQTWLGGAKPSVFLASLRWLKLGSPSWRRRAGVVVSALLFAGLAATAAWHAMREPIPFPDPASATRTVAVLPVDAQKTSPATREAARQLAAHLQLPSTLHLLPFEATLNLFSSKDFPSDDVDASDTLGAFLFVDVVALAGTRQFALRASDVLREERLYEADFTLADVDAATRKLGEALAQRRQQPTPESHLSPAALASMLRAIRWLQAPAQGTNEKAIAALKDAISKAPESALAHAWLAYAYNQHGGEAFWTDSAIDEAARAQRMDPTLGLAVKQLGAAYYAKSWFTRATAAFEQSLALGSVYVESELCLQYYARARFDESYRMCRERQRFETDDPFPQAVVAQLLFTVGENDAGERAMRVLIGRRSEPALRTLREAEIALYRRDSTRCRKLAGSIDPATLDGYFSASGLIRTCAAQQGDFVAALATIDATKRAYASESGSANGNNPALPEAILLAQLNRNDKVPALLKEARQGLQAAIDSNSEYPRVWLRMAAAQRLGGEVDAAYASLEHAFALGLTVNNRNRSDLEFLPFLGDARFQSLRVKSEAYVAAQREKIVQQLDPAMREPVANGPQGVASRGAADAVEPPAHGDKPSKI
jgi:Tfp pilus assembly protein PilF